MNEDQTSTGAGASRASSARKAESWLDPAKVDLWLAASQPGARLVYFHGWTPTKLPEALRDKLHREQDRGMLRLHLDAKSRDVFGIDHIAVRTSRPIGGDAGGKPERRAATLSEQARAEGEKAFRSFRL